MTLKKKSIKQKAWELAIKKYPSIDNYPTVRYENEQARSPFVEGYLLGLKHGKKGQTKK